MPTLPKFLLEWIERNPVSGNLAMLGLVLILAALVHLVVRRYLLVWLKWLVRRGSGRVGDVLLRESVARRLALLAPALMVHWLAIYVPDVTPLLQKAAASAIILLFFLVVGAIIQSAGEYYVSTGATQGRPVKGYVQSLNLGLYIAAAIVVLGVITGESPWAILSGVGAITAILVLVFRDPILNIVASITITSNDLIRVGDWIESPKYGTDGDVIDIALSTVQIQNFDNTISVVPTHKLIEESFRNYRGMRESGARRIKRSIYIDQTSITFLTNNSLDRLERIPRIADYIHERRSEIDSYNREKGLVGDIEIFGRRMTTIGTFRVYTEAYLRDHPMIRQDMTIMAHPLQPTPDGLPLEIYAFVGSVDGAVYERVQADIFDHLISLLPQFELAILQRK